MYNLLIITERRKLPLQHEMITLLIAHYKLDDIWLPDRAVHYLLLAGLLPETVWISHEVGDWKSSLVLAATLQYQKKQWKALE